MDPKQKFLDELRLALRKYPSGDVEDYIDYYEELITDHIAHGEKEAMAIRRIGTPTEAAASFKQDVAVNRAVKKPTFSNSIKAFIAVLGLLSLPLLIPIVIVLLALIITIAVLFVSGFAVLAGATIYSILAVVDMASIVFTGSAPVYLLFLVTGAALIVIGMCYELARSLCALIRLINRSLIHKMHIRYRKNKQQKSVNSEEQ